MAFSLHCKKTGKFITVNGNPEDYTKMELDNLCYGPATFSIKIGEEVKLELGDRKVTVHGLDASDAKASTTIKVD